MLLYSSQRIELIPCVLPAYLSIYRIISKLKPFQVPEQRNICLGTLLQTIYWVAPISLLYWCSTSCSGVSSSRLVFSSISLSLLYRLVVNTVFPLCLLSQVNPAAPIIAISIVTKFLEASFQTGGSSLGSSSTFRSSFFIFSKLYWYSLANIWGFRTVEAFFGQASIWDTC